MVKVDTQDVQSDLVQALQKSWVEYAGIHPACVRHHLVELDQSIVWSNAMSSVMCVTRSGEGGIRAQKEAIRIAKQRGDPLVFLCVADSSFLD